MFLYCHVLSCQYEQIDISIGIDFPRYLLHYIWWRVHTSMTLYKQNGAIHTDCSRVLDIIYFTQSLPSPPTVCPYAHKDNEPAVIFSHSVPESHSDSDISVNIIIQDLRYGNPSIYVELYNINIENIFTIIEILQNILLRECFMS